jgi:hypothetical protein
MFVLKLWTKLCGILVVVYKISAYMTFSTKHNKHYSKMLRDFSVFVLL